MEATEEAAGHVAIGRAHSAHELSLSADTKGHLLLEACEHKDAVEHVRTLLDAGASLEVCDLHGRSPLAWCGLLGNTEGARALLLAGADPDRRDAHGWTAARLAKALGHAECAALIEAAPAERKRVAENPGSLLWAAACPDADEEASLAAVAAAVARGDDLDAPCGADGLGPLHHAALSGRTRLLRALLEAGASAEAEDSVGRSALAWAAAAGRLPALRLLVKAAPAAAASQALWLAAYNGNAEATRVLLLGSAQADPALLLLGVEAGGGGRPRAGRGSRGAPPGVSRRALATLSRALGPEELARCVVLSARALHPLVTCLQGSFALERVAAWERARDPPAAARLVAASAALEALACGLVRTGVSRASLLAALLSPDGRTAIELAVGTQRKRFVALPDVQAQVDKMWYKGGALFHATQRHGAAAYGAAGLACLLSSPALLLASWAGSGGGALRSLLFDLDLLYAPLERFAARELSLLAFLIACQWLRRVDAPSASPEHGGVAGGLEAARRFEYVLGMWCVALWVSELQRAAVGRLAQLRRRGLAAEVWTAATAGWGGVDLVALSLALSTAAVRCVAYSEGASRVAKSLAVSGEFVLSARVARLADVEQKMRAIAALCLWLRFLHTLSIFSWLGSLLNMVLAMLFQDVLKWAVLQLVVLVAFASSLSALYAGLEPDPAVPGSEEGVLAFGSMGRAMKVLFECVVGPDEPYPARTWELVASSGLGWAIMSVFLASTYLLLLNLLIALLAATVDAIRSRSELEYAWSRATTILQARNLPIIPAPLNLLHLSAKLLGWVISPALRAVGALPARAEARAAAAEAELCSNVSRQMQRAVAQAASALRVGMLMSVGVLVGQAEAEAESCSPGSKELGWARPPEAESRRVFEAAWADVRAHEAEKGATAAALAALQRDVTQLARRSGSAGDGGAAPHKG